MSDRPLLVLLLIAVLNLAAFAAPPRTIVVNAPATQPAGAAAEPTVASASSTRVGNVLNVQRSADLSVAFDEQLKRLLTEQPTLAESELAPLAPEDRALLKTLIEGLARFRLSARSASTIAEKTKPLLELSDRLKDNVNLAVSNLTLCESVDRFGVYTPLSVAQLPANRETPTILYCEIENSHAKLSAKGMYETRLTYELSLYPDSAGGTANPVFSKPATSVIDRCRNRRRDFFIADRVTFPAHIAAGRYVLKVTVTDTQAKRIGEATLPVQLVARP